MKKKVILTSIVSFVLLLLVIFAGINAIYTVTSVRANFSTFSAEGESEAHELQEKLNSFVNKSSIFLKVGAIQDTVNEYPYFYLDEVKKHYPDRVELKISERKEAFTYLSDGKYVVLDEAGKYLCEKETNANRAGGENILLEGFNFAGDEVEYLAETLQMFNAFQKELLEARANIVSVKLERNTSFAATDNLIIQMHEGVVFRINDPHARTDEKVRMMVECYNGLSDLDRVTQEITIQENKEGEIKPSYSTDRE